MVTLPGRCQEGDNRMYQSTIESILFLPDEETLPITIHLDY